MFVNDYLTFIQTGNVSIVLNTMLVKAAIMLQRYPALLDSPTTSSGTGGNASRDPDRVKDFKNS